MRERFRRHLRSGQLLQRGERIVVAFSSGPDSLALLTLLAELRAQEDWQIAVGHLDHQLRPESVIEAEQVRSICGQLGLACFQEVCDVAELARQRGLGIEEAGRAARYDFLLRVARDFGASALAFGHQADDQLEQFFIRALRGASPASLAGMPERRQLEPGLRLVRPLLGFSRREIELFLAQEGLQPYQDLDNFLLEFDRNRIRHRLVPLLNEIKPGWQTALARTMHMLEEDEAFFQAEVDKAYMQGRWRYGLYSWPLKAWRELAPVVRKRLLLHSFRVLGQRETEQPIQYRHLQELERSWSSLAEGKLYTLPGRRALQSSRGRLYFLQDWPPPPWSIGLDSAAISRETSRCALPLSSYSTAELRLCIVNRPQQGWAATKEWGRYLSVKHLGKEWLLRPYRGDDTLALEQHRRSLKAFFSDIKLPLPERACCPLLLIEGEVASVLGLRSSALFGPDENELQAVRMELANGDSHGDNERE